jgi:hypothetical protein
MQPYFLLTIVPLCDFSPHLTSVKTGTPQKAPSPVSSSTSSTTMYVQEQGLGWSEYFYLFFQIFSEVQNTGLHVELPFKLFSLYSIALMMEEPSTTETLVHFYQTTRRNFGSINIRYIL